MKFRSFIPPMMLLFVSVCLFAFVKKDEKVNFTVKKVVEFDKSKFSLISYTSTSRSAGSWNTIMCSDGTMGCGTSPHPACGVLGRACAPTVALREISCPNFTVRGCATNGTTAPVCPMEASCPPPPPGPADNHPAVCSFGPIGCFVGSVGGPGCAPLVNCQNPPD